MRTVSPNIGTAFEPSAALRDTFANAHGNCELLLRVTPVSKHMGFTDESRACFVRNLTEAGFTVDSQQPNPESLQLRASAAFLRSFFEEPGVAPRYTMELLGQPATRGGVKAPAQVIA